MDPAKYDITVYRGTSWKRTIRRRDLDGNALPVAAPCMLAVRKMTPNGESAAITFSVTGTVDQAGLEATFGQDGVATAALTLGPYRYVLSLTEPDLDTSSVVLEGDFTVKPGVA